MTSDLTKEYQLKFNPIATSVLTIVFLMALFAFFPDKSMGEEPEPTLDKHYESKYFYFLYSDNDTSNPRNNISEANVKEIAENMDAAADFYKLTFSKGFSPGTTTNNKSEVKIIDEPSGEKGNAPIILKSPAMNKNSNNRLLTPAHELFHRVVRKYTNDGIDLAHNKWWSEGLAEWAALYFAAYKSNTGSTIPNKSFLVNMFKEPETSLLDQPGYAVKRNGQSVGYKSFPFWIFAHGEKKADQPNYNFIADFLSRIEYHPVTSLNEVIQSFYGEDKNLAWYLQLFYLNATGQNYNFKERKAIVTPGWKLFSVPLTNNPNPYPKNSIYRAGGQSFGTFFDGDGKVITPGFPTFNNNITMDKKSGSLDNLTLNTLGTAFIEVTYDEESVGKGVSFDVKTNNPDVDYYISVVIWDWSEEGKNPRKHYKYLTLGPKQPMEFNGGVTGKVGFKVVAFVTFMPKDYPNNYSTVDYSFNYTVND